ncbi:MAG: cytochrome C oxidase subunit IV family protein [Mariniblastus sp.]
MTGETDNHDHQQSHSGVFIAVFVMLCVLTGFSFWIANSHLMDNPMVGWGAMMAVSVAKALLVILFFMHLWWERAWKYVLTIPALIMGVLLVMLLVPDVGFRTKNYSNERWSNAAIPNADAVKASSDTAEANSDSAESKAAKSKAAESNGANSGSSEEQNR